MTEPNIESDIENDSWDSEAEESWGEGTAGEEANSDNSTDQGPINPLAAIYDSGKFDTDKVPDNPNVMPKGTYDCELKSVEICAPGEFTKGRHFIRLTFAVTDAASGYMFKTVRKNIYIPTPSEMKDPTTEAQELADKMRQAYFSLGVPKSEYSSANLQDYVKTSYKVGVGVMEMDNGNEINVIRWWKPAS